MKRIKHKIHDGLTVEQLNDELFQLVEKSQGFAFISDGMGVMSKDKFFSAVRSSLWYTLVTAKQLKKFLCKYGE